jgi:CubicO group peptidase (beta-lactamase class C family)
MAPGPAGPLNGGMQSADVPPVAGGRLDAALDLVRSRGVPAQLCVIRDGQVVLSAAVGCGPEALFWILSAGKPLTALLIHLLAERGAMALDDPVARYWPEFGQAGKAAITIRQVLQHRSGMPTARGMLIDGLAMASWQQSVRAIERAAPRWPPGREVAYQPLVYGFILGEVIGRVTGTGVREFLRAELTGPLGLADTYLGLPAPLWPRHVPVRVRGPGGPASQALFNRRAVREAVIPAAGISTTAADLARLYQALLEGGQLSGVRVLAPETVAAARQPAGGVVIDKIIGLPIRWGHGFQLGYPDSGRPRPMGRLADDETFGHNGSNCCVGWASPAPRLAVAYLTSVVPGWSEGARHLSAVSDAIRRACA